MMIFAFLFGVSDGLPGVPGRADARAARRRRDDQPACVALGLAHGRVVATAAAIMIVAFGRFAAGSDIAMKIGFGLAVAVARRRTADPRA